MIRRSEHSADKKFTLISRAVAQDSSLTFQARGLLLYVLSKPSNWSAKDADLMRAGSIGEKALASIVRELKTAGYIRRTRKQKPGTGKFYFVTEVFEEPELSDTEPYPPEGGMAPYPPQPCTDNGGTAIDSTGARAGSSDGLTRSKEKEPPLTFPIGDLKEPDTISGLRNQLAAYDLVPFEDAYADWFAKYVGRGIGRTVESKCTLEQYAVHIENHFRKWQRNAEARGRNGHKQADETEGNPVWMSPAKPVGYFEEMYKDFNKQ